MKEAEKKMFEEIFSSKEKLQAVLDFVNTWNNGHDAFAVEKIKEAIQKNDENYKDVRIYNNSVFAKKISDDVSIYYAGYACINDIIDQIGYVSNNDNPLPNPLSKSLAKVFEEVVTIKPKITNDVWIWNNLSPDEKYDLQERSDKIIFLLKKLEEKAFSNK